MARAARPGCLATGWQRIWSDPHGHALSTAGSRAKVARPRPKTTVGKLNHAGQVCGRPGRRSNGDGGVTSLSRKPGQVMEQRDRPASSVAPHAGEGE
ncbi:hypothetical protein NL676_030593 [Syzygium grande]|nr:hypothetical protein NL676_030593 [Syzygium grande]